MAESGPLLVADAPWLLYRAHFGLPASITGVQGRPVNALLGTANALLAAAEEVRPRAIVVCFGAEEATHRVAAYRGYHAHREPMPAELRWQFTQAPVLFDAFGWEVADAGELEADDLLGSFARIETEAGADTLILTADRDMYQCVSDRTSVVHLRRGGYERVDEAGVRSRYGINPAQVPDLIALRGDPSDGIPGAPGIGAKTAASLLNRFSSLEGVLAEAAAGSSQLRPKLAENLRAHAEQLQTFKAIATLVPIDLPRPSDTHLDPEAASAAASALGLGQLARRLADSVRG